jgi:hypothetical protein
MVAPQSQNSHASPSTRRRRRRSGRSRNAAVPVQELTPRSGSDQSVVHAFRPKPKPLWLMMMIRTQQATSALTLLLITSVLVIYGWTVYIQQRWGYEYARLETLKKRERQITSANELLKNQIAEQAESPTTGLLLPDPSNAIFLAPAPQRPPVEPKTEVAPAAPMPDQPLGY